jgi:phage/plasmid-like protein (TIGR03299 family)
MAHNIMGNRFLGSKPAWHNIGTIVSGVSAEAGVKLINADYGIEKLPVGAYNPATQEYIIFEGDYMLVRQPTHDDPQPAKFGYVSENYELLQNTEIAAIVDKIIDGTSYKLDTIGVLGNGETIFFCLENGTHSVKGEEVKLYFTITDKRDGGSSLVMLACPVRVVCWNTLSLALRTAQASVNVRHNRGMLAETNWRADVIVRLHKAGDNIITALRKLESITVTDTQAEKILSKIFPMPTKPASMELKASNDTMLIQRADQAEYHYEWRKKQAAEAKNQILTNYERLNDEYPAIAATGWSMFNAVTEYVDHQRGKSQMVRSRESLFGVGQDIRDKAYEYILATKK